MWSLQKILQTAPEASRHASPPVIPLRKPSVDLSGLKLGQTIYFNATCPLEPLSGNGAEVVAARQYRFGADIIDSFQLSVNGQKHYFLTVAEDDQGQYLSISRSLSDVEQDIWFGRDALSFFTEASSAKSIRCKADMAKESEWAAERYTKSVDWVEGTLAPAESPRLARSFHYNLLVNLEGDKALEIEHDDVSDENRVFITVYRPIEDISSVETKKREPLMEPVLVSNQDKETPAPEVPLFKEPVFSSTPAQPKQRQDFRRLEQDNTLPIHIERTPQEVVNAFELPSDLPSFLLQQAEEYVSLEEIMAPETERVRVAAGAAYVLLNHALRKNVRVRDVLRDMLGLQSALSEEVIFEMPLTEEDYHTLAMRYKLRPDHKVEIRSRLEEELRQKLAMIAKDA